MPCVLIAVKPLELKFIYNLLNCLVIRFYL